LAVLFLDFRICASYVSRFLNVSDFVWAHDVGGHGKSLRVLLELAFLPLILGVLRGYLTLLPLLLGF
jgi:hypothetical protein